MWWIYNLLFPLVFLGMLPKYLLRMWKRGGYRQGFLQRLGRYEPAVLAALVERPRIWIHSVSVGETFVALKFMEAFRQAQPGSAFVLTVNTSTAHALAVKKLPASDVLLYFPVDFPSVIRRVLAQVRPQALILVEGELWPNLIRILNERAIPIMLLNGRLSERSYRGYRKLRSLVRDVLGRFDLACVQGEDDAARLKDLGLPVAYVHVLGSAKYDVADLPSGRESEAVGTMLVQAGMAATDRLLVGGSTWEGEEAVLLDVLKDLRATDLTARLILVPRHAERAPDVVRTLEASGLSFVRRSRLTATTPPPASAPDVLLVDTTGELRAIYAAATVIFVGKSLTCRGGQNIIEPAVYAKPIIVGPNMQNFMSVMTDFLSAQAIIQVPTAEALRAAILDLWPHEAKRSDYGRRAFQVVESRRGVLRASVGLCRQHMKV